VIINIAKLKSDLVEISDAVIRETTFASQRTARLFRAVLQSKGILVERNQSEGACEGLKCLRVQPDKHLPADRKRVITQGREGKRLRVHSALDRDASDSIPF